MWLLDLTKDSNGPQIIIGKVIYRKTLQEKLQKLQNRTTDNYEIRFDMKCLNLETTCLYRLISPQIIHNVSKGLYPYTGNLSIW